MNYSPSLDDGDAEKNKLGWLLSTGLRLGKNLVMAGVVISSVPVLLPPLVVISAIGFAFSVPFGVVFASYTCSQNLMSKLLPSPALPPINVVLPYEEEEEEVVANATEKEEEEEIEATKDAIEMRIELVDKYDVGDETRNLQESLASTEELDDSDVGECSEEKDDKLSLNNATAGTLNKEERKQHSLEPSKDIEKPSFSSAAAADTGICGNASESDDHAVVILEFGNAGDRKCEGHENTSSLLEDVKFSVPALQVQTYELDTEEGEQNVTNMKEREKTVMLIEGTEKDKKHETLSKASSKEIEGLGKKTTWTALRFPEKRKETEGDTRNERLSGKERESPEETKSSSDSNLVMESKLGPGEKLCAEEAVVVQETSREKLDSVSEEKEQADELECTALGSEYLENKQIQGKSNHKVLLNDDVGNMDSSSEKERKPGGIEGIWRGQNESAGGVDINIEERTVMVYNDLGENYNQSRNIADDGEYPVEIAVLADIPESKYDEEIPKLKDAADACKVYSDLHSDEGQFCDEKIWNKIDAIRAIVGFKAPRRSSYFEELKALYLFTGIEPPSSSTDPSDLTDLYNKLCFLMSVIGLK